MDFEQFEEELRKHAIVETIYNDTEGRRILVATVLDVFVAFNKMLKEEREACLSTCQEVCESYRGTDWGKHAEAIIDNCMAAIRARGTNAA